MTVAVGLVFGVLSKRWCVVTVQVRPKSVPCTNVPIAPAPPPMMAAPQLLQRPVMVAAKIAPSSVTPIHQLRILNGQTPPTTLTGIVITTSTRLNAAPPPSSTQPIGSPAPLPPSSTQPISSLDANTVGTTTSCRTLSCCYWSGLSLILTPPPLSLSCFLSLSFSFCLSRSLTRLLSWWEDESRRLWSLPPLYPRLPDKRERIILRYMCTLSFFLVLTPGLTRTPVALILILLMPLTH